MQEKSNGNHKNKKNKCFSLNHTS